MAVILGMSLMSTFTSAIAKSPNEDTAIVTASCLYCVQPPFDNAEGVSKTTVGYTGGHLKNPTYKDVTSETTGHYEAIQIVYDPKVISYEQILDIFWHNIDPTDEGGQFFDRGQSYQTVIFFNSPEQKEIALASRKAAEEKLGKKIATKILPAETFYTAEEYHQEYYKKNKLHYEGYKQGSGRTRKINQLWGNTQP